MVLDLSSPQTLLKKYVEEIAELREELARAKVRMHGGTMKAAKYYPFLFSTGRGFCGKGRACQRGFLIAYLVRMCGYKGIILWVRVDLVSRRRSLSGVIGIMGR